jgi:hypothetical protein
VPIVGVPGDRCLSSVLGLFGRRLAARKEQVELAASLMEDLACLRNVRRVSGSAYLSGCCKELEHLLAQVAMIPTDRSGGFCPRCGTRGKLGRLFLACVGQLKDATTAIGLDGADQAFILKLLEGGIDGSGTGAPRAFAASFELLDDLVPMRLLLSEEHENRGPDVAAGGSPAVAAEASGTTETGESGVTSQPGIVKG